jgi:cation:H+ antiporter
MMFWFFLLIASLYLLYKVSNTAERELVKYAEYSGISHLSIGFIFIAAASSLPELSISTSSAFLGNQEISVGVSLGNVLYDLLLVLPLVAIWYGVKFSEEAIRRIRIISTIAIISLFPILFLKHVPRIYGLAIIISFLILINFILKRKTSEYRYTTREEKFRNKIVLAISLLSLSILSYLVNLSVKMISETAKIPTLLIGSLLIPIFTCTPELFSCLAAVKRKNYDVILGIIFGVLAFDSMFLIGSVSIIAPITISNINQFYLLYFFLFTSLTSINIMFASDRKLSIYSSIFLLMLFALWIFLSILFGI